MVDDGSTDATAAIAQAKVEAWPHGTARLLPGPASGAGWARRIGLDHALAAAGASNHSGALIATTDADSRVPAHWLTAIGALADQGHQVIAGDVCLDRDADPQLVEARGRRLVERLVEVQRRHPQAEHPHFAGANLAWSADALASLTPLPTPVALEDDALRARCDARGLDIVRDASFPVVTSSRTVGRAKLGLAAALADDARRLGLATSHG